MTGRVAVVTGASSGVGFHTARMLAGAGATVVLACRDAARAATTKELILAETPTADLEVVHLDLADLESVRAAAEELDGRDGGIDVLVNNAGVMGPPKRLVTAQGFEPRIGTNHLGHFALTALALPALDRSGAGRVVSVTSLVYPFARSIREADLTPERRYSAYGAYSRSKLANLMFAVELDRRLRAAGSPVLSVAAHPGFTRRKPRVAGPRLGQVGLAGRIMGPLAHYLADPVEERGARPLVYAATSPSLLGGELVGPKGPLMRGRPVTSAIMSHARDPQGTQALWELSEKATGVSPGLPPAMP